MQDGISSTATRRIGLVSNFQWKKKKPQGNFFSEVEKASFHGAGRVGKVVLLSA